MLPTDLSAGLRLPELCYGTVWLVGTGSGDPRRLPPAALDALGAADVVFHGSYGDVVTFDTGRLFPETLEVWGATERRYGRRIRGLSPDRDSIERLIERDGVNGFRQSIEARPACCSVRKVAPLGRALAGASAWITGLRADQSAERAMTSYASVDPQYRLVKVNPLFDWTRDHVVAFVRDHGVPDSQLHQQGFLSIGCAPCTRAVTLGEPERAGRPQGDA